MYEYAPQADQLASQGRYGDSMMVHMNPLEVALMNKMSGNQMTVNPRTGQPEAFAFLLPLLGSIGGTALGAGGGLAALGLTGGTALAAGAGGALGSALGQTAATGSLKEGLKTGLLSAATAGAAGALSGGLSAGTEAARAAGTEAAKGGILSQVAPQAAAEAGADYAARAAQQAAIAGNVSGALPGGAAALQPSFDALPRAVGTSPPVAPSSLDLLKAAALPGAFSGVVGASQYVPGFEDDDPDFLGKRSNIPEASPPTRRLDPTVMGQQGMGERLFFNDPNPNAMSGNRPMSTGSSFASAANKYGGNVSRMQEGGLASIDPNAMPAPMPQEMMASSMDADMSAPTLEEQVMMQSESGREDSARVFNEAVSALMGQHPAPKEVLRRFLEIFGEERLMALVDQVRRKMESPQEGRMVMGQGEDGVDNIPASVEGEQPVLLANNEYILPEKVTTAFGNGDPGAGAELLDEMVANVQ